MRLHRTEQEIEAYLQDELNWTEDDLKQRQQIQEKVGRDRRHSLKKNSQQKLKLIWLK